MLDTTIDYFEIEDLGAHFIGASRQLDDLSPVVNWALVRSQLGAAVAEVVAELRAAGLCQARRGALGGARTDATDALVAAHGRFLAVYSLAKRLVLSVLTDLGRAAEASRFFLEVGSRPEARRGPMATAPPPSSAAHPTLPDFAGAEQRRALLGAMTFLELGKETPVDIHTLLGWYDEHVVALECMPTPLMVHEPPFGAVSLRPSEAGLGSANAAAPRLVSAARSRVVSALRGLITVPCDDRFLQSSIFLSRVRRSGAQWIARPEPEAPLSGVVLSLFATSILTDRSFYEATLCICMTCDRVSFSSAATARRACHEHTHAPPSSRRLAR